MAEQQLPRMDGLIPRAIIGCSTLGQVLDLLRYRKTHSVEPQEIIDGLNTAYGCSYSPADYENWRRGIKPSDPMFPEHLVEVACSFVHAKDGIWVTTKARDHIRALASGTSLARTSSQER